MSEVSFQQMISYHSQLMMNHLLYFVIALCFPLSDRPLEGFSSYFVLSLAEKSMNV